VAPEGLRPVWWRRHCLRVKLLLVDGHYYAYRSFFAIRNLSNSKGEPTNAIYGFVKAIRKMLKNVEPDMAAVIWDEGLPQRRTELQPEYKANRAEMPDEMRLQLDVIRDLVPKLGIASLSMPDTEADDLIASYTVAARAAGIEVVLATNDKDLFQLVDGGVRIYSTNKTDLASPSDSHALLDEAAVTQKWGVPPGRIGDVLALTGDSADNIPGLPGFGPKTTVGLLLDHGSLDAILANPAAVRNTKLRDRIESGRAQIESNREMVRLDRDLPLPVAIESMKIAPRYDELVEALARCEFKTLLNEVRTEADAAQPRQQGELF
jgi:5'-3' exonuclease